MTVLDGSIDFWADRGQCNLIKRYDNGDDNWRGPTTLSSIKRFMERRQREEKQVKSGDIPDGWCVDLEDGHVKPRHECDMPAN